MVKINWMLLIFLKKKNYGKHLKIIDDELHYQVEKWHTKRKTYIKPNYYITFMYDEDDWWYVRSISIDEYKNNFIEINETM